MRYQGRLQDWNDDKGFGFVTPNGGGERAFVHIKAFDQRGQRPSNGALISYAVRKDERNRLNATAVRLADTAGARGRNTPASRGRSATPGRHARHLPRIALGLSALLSLAACGWLEWIPAWSALVIVSLSLVALLLYALDKAAAQQGHRRTPENTLHLVSLLGGWPGALMAQGLFHHKHRKRSFQVAFWLTVLIHCGVLYLLASGRFTRVH